MRTELFMYFLYIGTQGEVCTVKGLYTPGTDRSKAVVPMLFLFCVDL